MIHIQKLYMQSLTIMTEMSNGFNNRIERIAAHTIAS